MDPINFRTNRGIHFGKVSDEIRTKKSENASSGTDIIKILLTENNGAKHVSDVNRLQVVYQNLLVPLEPDNLMLELAGVTKGRRFAYLNQIVADGLKDLAKNIEDIGTESNVESFKNSLEMKILGNLA